VSAAFDLAIVGAGPAGMAAASAASALKLATVVLDEQPEPGGQIYRGIERLASSRPGHLDILGDDYAAGLDLARAFRASDIEYMSGTQVWQVEPGGRVFYRRNGKAGILTAKQTLIAAGAMERPLPIPGWTLPGVLTCGAGQTLLKANGLVPQGRFVLAGCGPLLLLLAAQLVRAGIKPAAVLQTTFNRWAAAPHLAGFLALPAYLAKGLALLRELKAAGVPTIDRVTHLALKGDDRVRAVEYAQGGARQTLAVDHVFLHQGVVPNGNLALSLGVEHEWNDLQRCYRPRLDAFGRSSRPGVLVAGDAGGIVGAKGAQYMGEIAATAAARDLGRIDLGELVERTNAVRARFAKHRAARPFLDALYRPAQQWVTPEDPDTIVCRCEEVRAGEVRDLVARQHCPGPNQLKSFVRAGMGPCQGRLCGLTIVELIARTRGVPVGEVGYYRIRPPIKPVTLGDLAALDVPERNDAIHA
jgi:thioredoxin reductase